MSSRSTDCLSSILLGLALAASPAAAAAPAAATSKEPERITVGTGPATLTAADRAKAEAHGIRIPAGEALLGVRPIPAPTTVTFLRPGEKPADTGTRLPSVGPRERRKPDGMGPVDAARQGVRP